VRTGSIQHAPPIADTRGDAVDEIEPIHTPMTIQADAMTDVFRSLHAIENQRAGMAMALLHRLMRVREISGARGWRYILHLAGGGGIWDWEGRGLGDRASDTLRTRQAIWNEEVRLAAALQDEMPELARFIRSHAGRLSDVIPDGPVYQNKSKVV
jgi:hypothetical protein